MVRLACLLTVALGTQSASAHEKWANGEDVPAWDAVIACARQPFRQTGFAAMTMLHPTVGRVFFYRVA